jgi:hypothetical protein
MKLTRRQLDALRQAPVGPTGNRIAAVIDMLETTIVAVANGTALPYTYVSDVKAGRFQTITVEKAHKFADYFGCHIEDLFPSREAIAS